MTRSLAQIKRQIAKLQHEAESIETKERTDVIKRIREAIAHYSLSSDELFTAPAKRTRSRKAVPAKARSGSRPSARSASKGRKVAPKYRDTSGNTWTGRGSKPRWLVAALAEGKTLDQFAL
jgi:DNA-binding protein H-NS